MLLLQEKIYEKLDYTTQALKKGEYDNCTFYNCNFSSVDLTGMVFTECVFNDCNFTMANLKGTAFKEVEFNGCKMTGLNFSICEPFLLAMQFSDCQLNLASFYGLKLKNIRFKKCNLEESDLVQADFRGASFDECNLRNAVFENTNLEKADLRSAVNFSLDPENNRIEGAKFSLDGLPGLLNKYNLDIE